MQCNVMCEEMPAFSRDCQVAVSHHHYMLPDAGSKHSRPEGSSGPSAMTGLTCEPPVRGRAGNIYDSIDML